MKLKKEKKLSHYKKKAWEQFSKFIRIRDSKNGYTKCCTCELVDEWKYLQAGHYVAGRNNSILFREDNCHAQCVGCNYFGGNANAHGKYYQFMKAMYGIERIDELELTSNRELKYTQSDYQEIESKYKMKFEAILNKH